MSKHHCAWLLAAAVLAGLGPAAWAAEAPKVGPAPDWVRAAPDAPAEKDDLKGAPVVSLLNDTQFSFDADGWTEFHHTRLKVQTAEGLQAVGTIPVVWSPWSDTVTFHWAGIERDGQTIDVLPKDGAFTVLRREPGLEQAMLTGELTALLQPDGMQVGDVLDIAVSIRHADPILKGAAGASFSNWDAGPVARVRLLAHWPSSLPVRWRETAGLPPLRRTDAGGMTTVALDMDDVRPPVPPAGAPARFQHGREVEFGALPDWTAVARAMAPLYAKASELAPGSPVAAQATAIASTTSDAKARAGAALRLVQDQVRYLAHVEAAGGYTPQAADETWRLRYGDCKAKTALLLALLKQLGVPAAPALASIGGGDGLDAHLPSAIRFDHVLVRVSLGGKDYWLDGTRQGDRGLDDLATPSLGWVLPLDTVDGRLVRLVPAPASRPQMVQVIRYDASGGTTAPIPTQLKTTFRGDAAFLLHAQLSAVPPERLDAALKAFWAGVHTAFTPAHVAAVWDATTGEETITADGTSKLETTDSGLELQHVELGGAPDIKRDPASSDPDAPYVVAYPSYVETDESVVTPPGQTWAREGLKALAVDSTIAGVAYHRSGVMTGDVVSVRATQRALQPEISAAEARASVVPLTNLGNQGVYVAIGKTVARLSGAAAIDSRPTTVLGHLDRGNALLEAFRFQEALAEMDAAIALDPASQEAWALRALAHAWLADPAARADADKADSLGPPQVVAARARAVLAAQVGDTRGARAAYRQALALAPDDLFSLTHLIELELADSDLDQARKDRDALLKAHPDQAAMAHIWNAYLELAARHLDAARRELALAPADTADEALARARAYLAVGDRIRARADLDTAVRLKPSAHALLLRAALEGGQDSAAKADLAAAARLAPHDIQVQWSLSDAAFARRDFDADLAILNGMLADHPEMAGNLIAGRALLEARLGRNSQADADFLRAQAMSGPGAPAPRIVCNDERQARWRAATALDVCEKALATAPMSTSLRMDRIILLHRLGRDADALAALGDLEAGVTNAGVLNEICYQLATEDMALDRALADCDAALKLRPGAAAILDSRGFVLMRLKRDAEALAAYDAALAADSELYVSLYGRGLVEARLGRAADSARDIAAALAGDPHIRENFADFGIR